MIKLHFAFFHCILSFSFFLPDINKSQGLWKKGGPASDLPTMEGSKVESVSRGSDPVDQCENSLFNTEEVEQVSHNDEDEAENCHHAHDIALPDSEVMKTVTDIQTDGEMKDQTCSQDQETHELHTDVISDDATSRGGEKPLSNQTDAALVMPLDDVVESSPLVLQGTLLTFDDVKDSHAIHPNSDEHPFDLLADCPTTPPPAEDSASTVCPLSSVQCGLKHSPTDSTTTSGISNGPSTPSSDTVGSSPTSSPRTSVNTPMPSNSLSSLYDTDCSQKLISQIQRSLSQESLLDELESELLACQLPEEGKSPNANGLTDQEGCIVVFEKCVQYKYAQQEKAVQR